MRKPLLNASLACVVQVALWAGLPTTASAGPIRFDYTGSFTSYSVLTTGTYQIFAFGAQGGYYSVPGGLGAEVAGDIALTAGQILTIAVGGRGIESVGGGGGTFVVSGQTPLFIAGGGGSNICCGAGSAGQSGTSGATPTNGPNNVVTGTGGTNGMGGSSSTARNGTGGGGGGFLTDGGSNSTRYVSGTGGASYFNGLAGGRGAEGEASGGFGGGGGGGYSGGGGGVEGNGGGGGSYNVGMVNSDLISLAGVNAGDGFATLELLSPVSATVPAPSTISLLGLGLAGVGFFSRRRIRNTV